MSNYVRYPLVLGIVCLIAGLSLAVTFQATIGKIEERQAIKRSGAVVTAFFGAQPAQTTWNRYDEMDAETGKPVPEGKKAADSYFIGYKDDAKQEVLGYAAEGRFQGYSSKVGVLVGVASLGDGKYRILGLRVISQGETPGLGAQCNQVFSDETLWSRIGAMFTGDEGAKGPKASADEQAALGADVELLSRAAFERQFTGKEVTVANGVVTGLKLDKTSWEAVKSGEKIDDIAAITGATITSDATINAVSRAVLKIDGILAKASAR